MNIWMYDEIVETFSEEEVSIMLDFLKIKWGIDVSTTKIEASLQNFFEGKEWNWLTKPILQAYDFVRKMRKTQLSVTLEEANIMLDLNILREDED